MSKLKKASSGEDVVYNFLARENRPFSVQNLVDALQKHSIKKTAVERSLASLVENAKVTKKEYGKAKIFLVRQDNIDLPDEEEVTELDDQIKTLASDLAAVTARTDTLRKKLAALKKQYTLQEAQKRVKQLSDELAVKEEKRSTLGDGSKLMSKQEKLKMEQTYYNVRSLWKKYKRIVSDITDQIGEASGKSNAELYEEICIETDEAANVKISDFPEIKNPINANRPPTTIRALKRQRQN